MESSTQRGRDRGGGWGRERRRNPPVATSRTGRALCYLLALCLGLAIASWIASGDALESLPLGDRAEGGREGGGAGARAGGQPDAVDPAQSFAAAAERVGATAWGIASKVLAAAVCAIVVVLAARAVVRRRRRYRRYRLEPYRSDEASPEQVEDLFESWHQQLLRRWWLRIPLGQDSLALELGVARSDKGDQAELFVVCPERVADAVEGALRACYPNSRLVARDEQPAQPKQIIRLKKRYEFIRRLRTPRDYDSPLVDAALSQMDGVAGRATLQYVVTPTPALFDRLARSLFREQEAKLERARLRERGDPGLRSQLAGQELEGGLEIQHRTLFFCDLRVGAASYGDADAVAAALQGESSAENRLVERRVRRWARGPLYARRMQRALGNPVPSWRHGVVSSRELAGLWQLPSPGLGGVRLARCSVPRAVAPPEIVRDEGLALVRDEHGPLGIRAEDKPAGLGLIGGQGTGKTSVICRSVAVDARDEDCAQIVLDPKSDAAEQALSQIPRHRTVHYLDLERPELGINPLLAPGDPATVADKIVEALRDIHEEGDIRASSDRYMRQAALAIVGAHRLGAIEEEPNLWHLYRILLPSEQEFREHVIRAIESRPAFTAPATFFGRDLPDDLKNAPAATTAKLDAPRNKMVRLLVESLDKVLRHPNQLSLDELIRNREVLIVDGKMGTFGPDNCRVMMQFVLNMAYGAMQRQQQLPEAERARVALKVDEAHLILNESFANALATLRSSGLEVVAAWQYGEQVQDPKIRGGLMSLLRHRCVFSVGDASDAREMTELAMPVYTDVIRDERESRRNLRFAPDTLFNLPNFHALCSWISHGARTAGFVGETYPMQADPETIAFHRQAQRERGGAVPDELPNPFGTQDPLDRVPRTGPPAPLETSADGGAPPAQTDATGNGSSPSTVDQAEGSRASASAAAADTPGSNEPLHPAIPQDDKASRRCADGEAAAGSRGKGGAATKAPPRSSERSAPQQLDHARLGTIRGDAVPKSYTELEIDEPTGLRWDELPKQAPDKATEPTPEQLAALAGLYELRFLYGPQLGRRFWPRASDRTYRRHLEAMFKAGWVRRFQITERAGGQKQRIYMLTSAGFELARSRRGPRGPYIDPQSSWSDPDIKDARRVVHDLHAAAWLIAFEQLAGRLVRSWRGAREGRIYPPSRRERGGWVTLSARDIPLGGSRRIRDLTLDEFKPVEPDLTVELALPASPPQRFDVLVELDRSGRASRNRDKFARYDALLTAWGRAHDRYKMQGEPPVVVFVVEDEPKARSFVEAADEAITGAVVTPGAAPEQWEYPGRERTFFVCERDVHMGTLRAYRLPRYPIEVRKAQSGDRRRGKNKPEPEQLALLDRRLLRR